MVSFWEGTIRTADWRVNPSVIILIAVDEQNILALSQIKREQRNMREKKGQCDLGRLVVGFQLLNADGKRVYKHVYYVDAN